MRQAALDNQIKTIPETGSLDLSSLLVAPPLKLIRLFVKSIDKIDQLCYSHSMNRGGFTRFVPVILFIAVVVLIIAAFVSIGRNIFGESTSSVDPGRTSLVNTGNDRSVRMTVRGRIISEEDHRSYRITISSRERTLVTYRGYLERPIERRELDNNSRAYEEFVHALDRYKFMHGSEGEGEITDLRGRCPTGSLYEFEVLNAGGVVKRLWTTTCRGEDGTSTATLKDIRNLFREQIPDSNATIRELKIK